MAKSPAKKQQKPTISKPPTSNKALLETAAGAGRLAVKVFSPYQIYYQGEAVSLSASNKTGPFDVLVSHANFFSLLTAGEVIIETGYARLVFPVNRGVIKVTNDHVTVFVDV